MNLTNHQEIALNEILTFIESDDLHHVLKGAAGTGKSTLVAALTAQLDITYIITAPTHKAANVYEDAVTIHSLLNLKPKQCTNSGKMILKQTAPAMVTAELIIIDECSMIDEELLGFITAINLKVLFVGDSYQLAPIEGDRMPVFDLPCQQSELTEIMRQALNNPTLCLANKYRLVLDGNPAPHSIYA